MRPNSLASVWADRFSAEEGAGISIARRQLFIVGQRVQSPRFKGVALTQGRERLYTSGLAWCHQEISIAAPIKSATFPLLFSSTTSPQCRCIGIWPVVPAQWLEDAGAMSTSPYASDRDQTKYHMEKAMQEP